MVERLEKLPHGAKPGDWLKLTQFGLVKSEPPENAEFRLFVRRKGGVAEAAESL